MLRVRSSASTARRMCRSQASRSAGADPERRVPHPQPRVPALLRSRCRAAPVLHQEQAQPVGGRAQVLLRVHAAAAAGSVGDAGVELVDQPAEGRLAADRVEEVRCSAVTAASIVPGGCHRSAVARCGRALHRVGDRHARRGPGDDRVRRVPARDGRAAAPSPAPWTRQCRRRRPRLGERLGDGQLRGPVAIMSTTPRRLHSADHHRERERCASAPVTSTAPPWMSCSRLHHAERAGPVAVRQRLHEQPVGDRQQPPTAKPGDSGQHGHDAERRVEQRPAPAPAGRAPRAAGCSAAPRGGRDQPADQQAAEDRSRAATATMIMPWADGPVGAVGEVARPRRRPSPSGTIAKQHRAEDEQRDGAQHRGAEHEPEARRRSPAAGGCGCSAGEARLALPDAEPDQQRREAEGGGVEEQREPAGRRRRARRRPRSRRPGRAGRSRRARPAPTT